MINNKTKSNTINDANKVEVKYKGVNVLGELDNNIQNDIYLFSSKNE